MCYKVSIIVPVYNAEKYLGKCIESIISQTYRNLEIILVDDGSTDHSLGICKEYAKKDKRIIVVKQAHRGIVRTRQTGVKIAVGDFIGWADADDWMESGYIEKLVHLQRSSKADIVVAAHYHDIGDDSGLVKNGVDDGVYGVEQILPVMLYTGKFFEYGVTPQLYTKLFRADILKKILPVIEESIIAGDDAAVVYPALLMATRICVTGESGYHYVQHSGSITKIKFEDEYQRIKKLTRFLRNTFIRAQVEHLMNNQLIAYENYLISLRKIDIFDVSNHDKILIPYGGFRQKEKIVIYGAGVLGQKIHHYLEADGRVEIIGWIDKNYEVYRKQGLFVYNPDILMEKEWKYDYILIANITEDAAMTMKEALLAMGVREKKVRWFSEKFRGKYANNYDVI